MRSKIAFLLFVLSLLVSVVTSVPTYHSDDHSDDENDHNLNHPELTITCQSYKEKDCKEEGKCEEQEIVCPSRDKRQGCMALWTINSVTKKAEIRMKACFIYTETQCNQTECVDSDFEKSTDHYFCCCREDNCNKNFMWKPVPKPTTTTEYPDPSKTGEQTDETYKYFFAGCLVVFFISICFFAKFVYKRKGIFKSHQQIPTTEPELSISSQCLALRPIELIEIKAHGRFGVVWKGKMKNEEVAVKVFPTQDKNSWITEQEIYKLPRMSHPNVLRFIGAEKRIFQDNKTEFWLITEYHPYGSLCDYLKSHTVTWQELCKIAESMSRGLMHLHEEIAGTRTEELKPAIAHRDFKSKNVLLKADLTACVADFGLALVFNPGQPCGDVHGQVGTRRYMAPEILEGAINFNRDSFLRIDVYACGLVLWELVSRCTAHGGPVAEFTLPFEAELGPHPTLEEMQESIAAKKIRPRIYDEWRNHNGLSAICDTIEECWDNDAEARLSSSCIMERISQQTRYHQQMTIDQTTNFISRNNANDQ